MLYFQNIWSGKYLVDTVPKRRRNSAYLRNIDGQIFCLKSGEFSAPTGNQQSSAGYDTDTQLFSHQKIGARIDPG
jgi:hypothetical protein